MYFLSGKQVRDSSPDAAGTSEAGKGVEIRFYFHRLAQELMQFYTGFMSKVYRRICECGKEFIRVREDILWCSSKCRRMFYRAKRNKAEGRYQYGRRAKNKTRGGHTREQWLAKLKASNFMCYWCREYFDGETLQKEHLTPISRGGFDDISNIVPACGPCNREKWNKTAEEYTAFLHENGSRLLRLALLTKKTGEQQVRSKPILPEVRNMPQPIRDEFFNLADGLSMETIKNAVSESLSQKRRLYDELERRKLLKLA